MKKGFWFLGILLLLIGLGIFDSLFVSNILDTLYNDINTIIPEYENNESNITINLSYIEEIREKWVEDEKKLCLLFNHKDLLSITDGLNKIQTYTKINDFDNAMVELYLVLEHSQNNHHIMSFNLKNILNFNF